MTETMIGMTNAVVIGIWLPGKGWMRNGNDKIWADTHPEIAEQVAECVGGIARYVDESIIDFEPLYLQVEKNQLEKNQQEKRGSGLWHTLTNFWRNNSR